MHALPRGAAQAASCGEADSTTLVPAHEHPWGDLPDDPWLEALAGGEPLPVSETQRAALRALPDWLATVQERLVHAHDGALSLDDLAPLARAERQEARALLMLLPPGLLSARHQAQIRECQQLLGGDAPRDCSYEQLLRLRELLGELQPLFDRVVPGGARFDAEVLQGLAGLKRWERSQHDTVHPYIRQDMADLLRLAAVTDPERDASPTVLGAWRSGADRLGELAAPDLPDAELLRQLHLPPGLVRMELEGQWPRDWDELRRKAEAGGIALIG
ncbi:hypothetical protein [Roseateles noduli]|uniref:hypothetical protein n=1 Tax=Roseateles noduli TaxID=2052484 RepID=UPI003D64BF11